MQINKINHLQLINTMINLYYRQADGVLEFMPRFLQQGEWGKAFSQGRASSSEDNVDSNQK